MPRRPAKQKDAMDKTLICIGGGELRTKETLKIDGYIAQKARQRAGERRAYGLFVPTASHDSMPYFNSFRKTYTSVFDIKADVALTVYGEMSREKIAEKFQKADFVYVGGGDTVFMLEHWKQTGLLELIRDAYERGVLICGLSAGAICWFERMYTDSWKEPGEGTAEEYSVYGGLNWIKGIISPHYNLRALDFDKILLYNKQDAVGLQDNSAIEIINSEIVRSLSAGGNAYHIRYREGALHKEVIQPQVVL